MNNETIPSPKKFNNVILQLSQEMHYHVHRSKNPQLYSKGDLDDVTLANISQESEALASEYSDAISLLSNVENEIKRREAERLIADQMLQEEILLLEKDPGKMSIEINPQKN